MQFESIVYFYIQYTNNIFEKNVEFNNDSCVSLLLNDN